jgi:hypothetical protein
LVIERLGDSECPAIVARRIHTASGHQGHGANLPAAVLSRAGLPLLRVLTDRGTEYCGVPDRHPYESYLAIEDIDHTGKKTKRPLAQEKLIPTGIERVRTGRFRNADDRIESWQIHTNRQSNLPIPQSLNHSTILNRQSSITQ